MPAGVLALWPKVIPYASSFVTNPTRNFVSKQDLTNELQIDAEQYVSHFRRLKKSFLTWVSKHVYTIWVHIILQIVCLNCGILLCFAKV